MNASERKQHTSAAQALFDRLSAQHRSELWALIHEADTLPSDVRWWLLAYGYGPLYESEVPFLDGLLTEWVEGGCG